ncbi:DNA polymerase III subunit beta [Streptomyces sp. H39-C1]|uniref:DNA polymerase III subunit beta n=1 Tax=Streptomyces sp. H39-C1 TaxID=3004355 RepID=UPI0022AE7F28|nr:DNA polymerase III subunit beta [Streptomyces sp. H39-C1]MCZ4102643.1 DNA polymerase III subunit beta [Streptomyces sp. H39-C1]
MKLIVNPRALADAVTAAGRALPGRPPVPVMAALKLHADGNTLTVTGYDYDTCTHADAPAVVTDPGTVLVPGRLLADIARTLRQDVHVTTTDTLVTLESGSARFTLRTLPLEEYPQLPDDPGISGSLPSADFAAAIAQVAIAASRDDTLPVLTGVQMTVDGNTLTFAATDRYRFAVRTLQWRPNEPGAVGQALLPAKRLLETAKDVADDVRLFLSLPDESHGITGLIGETTRVILRGLEGALPNYESLFPTEFAVTADVNTDALAGAVKRVALVAERNTPVRFSFTQGAVTLEAGTSDEAQAVDGTDANYTDHSGQQPTFDIAFNPQYLLDGLTAIGHETTRFAFTTPHKPALLRADSSPDSGPDSGLQYLLMPVRLTG